MITIIDDVTCVMHISHARVNFGIIKSDKALELCETSDFHEWICSSGITPPVVSLAYRRVVPTRYLYKILMLGGIVDNDGIPFWSPRSPDKMMETPDDIVVTTDVDLTDPQYQQKNVWKLMRPNYQQAVSIFDNVMFLFEKPSDLLLFRMFYDTGS